MEAMKRWQPMTAEQLVRAEGRLRRPRPGSRIEAAQRYGVDLTLLIENLRRTPAERAERMLELCRLAQEVRGAARRKRP